MTQWAETKWKWIENKHMHINTLCWIILMKASFCLEGWYSCSIVKTICNFWHTVFTNLWFQEILNLWPPALFYKSLHSVVGKFFHSPVFSNPYPPCPPPPKKKKKMNRKFKYISSGLNIRQVFFRSCLMYWTKLCHMNVHLVYRTVSYSWWKY